MVDRMLNAQAWDIQLTNFDNPLVDGLAQIVQNCKIRLQTFKGEFFLNTRLGIPYFSDSFTKGKKDFIDTLIKTCIKETPEIYEILYYSSRMEPISRTFIIEFRANTIYGKTETQTISLEV